MQMPPSPRRYKLTETLWAVGAHSRRCVPAGVYSAPRGPV